MKKNIKNIHDKFFKKIMSNKYIAIDFLKTFLPKETFKMLNLDTLDLTNTSFITSKLDESFSDLVFNCLDRNKETIKISIILEHKSIIDKNTAIQILRYLVSAYELSLKNDNKIRVIIPILFYHGEKKWTHYSFESLFSNHQMKYHQYLPFYELLFVDLHQYPDKFISQLSNLFLSSALLTQKYSRNPVVLARKIRQIFNSLDPDGERNLFDTITVYYLELVELDKSEIIEHIVSLSPKIKNKVMSTYDQLIEEGKTETKKDVIIKGFQNGIPLKLLALLTDYSIDKIKSILSDIGFDF